MYLGASGLIVVSSIINYSDLDKVLKAINEAYSKIGDFDFSLDEIKEYFISNIINAKDNFNTLVDNYFLDNYFVKGHESYKELDKIKSVILLSWVDLVELQKYDLGIEKYNKVLELAIQKEENNRIIR